MPPSPAQTAESRATVESDISQLSLSDGRERHASEERAPATSRRKKRYKKRTRGSTKREDAAAEDAESVAAHGIMETDSVGEAESAEPNAAGSPPSDTDTIATEPLPHVHFGRALPQIPRPTYVEVPVLAHYELRELPSAGGNQDENDEGLFATQKIERGTRIISERPLFTLPAPGDQVPELMAAYKNLPKSDEETIWSLRPAAAEASQLLMNLRFLTDRLAMDLQNIMCKPEADRTQEDQATLAAMQPKLVYTMNVYRIAARWHANRCSLLEIPTEQRDELPNGTPITGLFMERAHIRHSCVPNCFASYDANVGRMNVHVTRDIAPGEELTLSSFAGDMYYSNAEDRKDELFAWGLHCNCEACDETHPRFQVHETARARAHTRAVLLNDILTRLEKEDMLEDDLNTAQKLLLDLIRDLKTSGCESVETVRWRNILVDRILPARALAVPQTETLVAWQVILGFARECERVGKMCYGEDRDDYRVLKQTREGTEATIQMLEEAIANEAAAEALAGEEEGEREE